MEKKNLSDMEHLKVIGEITTQHTLDRIDKAAMRALGHEEEDPQYDLKPLTWKQWALMILFLLGGFFIIIWISTLI